MNLRIVIPGEAKPLARHRTRVVQSGERAFSQAYQPAANVSNLAMVREYAFVGMREADILQPLDGPVGVRLFFGLAKPKSRSKHRPFPDSKPDCDNVVKLIFDAFNKVVWRDDAQVCDLVVRKRYVAAPYTEIIVKQLTAADAAKG